MKLSDEDIDRIANRIVDVMLERERKEREAMAPKSDAGVMPPFSLMELELDP